MLPNHIVRAIITSLVLLIPRCALEGQTFSHRLPHYPNAIPIANTINYQDHNCDGERGFMHCSVSFSTLDSIDSVHNFLVQHFEKDGWHNDSGLWQKECYPVTTERKRTFCYTRYATWATVYLETDANGKTTLVIDCSND